jgi:aspartyl-tRNA(Asn)/glutamyl-tRNA(Gln) amidotransferase subunit A
MSALHELTASQAAKLIRAGELRSTDLLEALLDRIAKFDSSLRAWVRLDTKRSRAEASARDAEVAAGKILGPLHGVPMGVKDIFFTEGMATEAGSPLRKDFTPAHDAATVARLRAAGAIILGKTETTQFAMGDAAPTRNPWNLEHTPGGSSSGSAAAVAARMVPAALGSQTAGSVLRPASFCGVVGFKPTYGRYSSEGIFPLAWSLDHPGTITRSVADARLLFTVLDEQRERLRLRPSRSKPRFGLLSGRFIDLAQPDVLTNLKEAAARLRSHGAVVRSVRLPDDFDLAIDVHRVIMSAEASAYHAADHLRQPDSYRSNLRALIETGALIPATVYLQAKRLREELREQALGLLTELDCLLMPSCVGTAPAGLAWTGSRTFTSAWSLFGMPAVSIPSGLDREGLPFGLQIVGPAGADAQTLAAAEWCEQVLGPLPVPAMR